MDKKQKEVELYKSSIAFVLKNFIYCFRTQQYKFSILQFFPNHSQGYVFSPRQNHLGNWFPSTYRENRFQTMVRQMKSPNNLDMEVQVKTRQPLRAIVHNFFCHHKKAWKKKPLNPYPSPRQNMSIVCCLLLCFLGVGWV